MNAMNRAAAGQHEWWLRDSTLQVDHQEQIAVGAKDATSGFPARRAEQGVRRWLFKRDMAMSGKALRTC
jgi:hypothetical protein